MFAFVSANIADTTLYKGVDSEGNVVYSDRPFGEAEKFTPPPISIMDARKVEPKKEVVTEEKPAEFKYTRFDIVSPTNNQTIWNEPDLTVSMKLTPALNSEQGHKIWLLMDGKPVIKNSRSMSLRIGWVERGAHQLQGQVRDKQGKIVARTRAVVMFIQHSSVFSPGLR
ncbi:MAG: hypothetical protein BMS9Abin19_0245 [Gammaproteobacteria bacterium]|nr:MAG: hypothetical protein BMS9Abin19_0245 [Gammaproteobacteria bacterium]